MRVNRRVALSDAHPSWNVTVRCEKATLPAMSFQPPEEPRIVPMMMYSAHTWKSADGARAAFGDHATWRDEAVDRAEAGDGELGTFNGIRCIVLKSLPG